MAQIEVWEIELIENQMEKNMDMKWKLGLYRAYRLVW